MPERFKGKNAIVTGAARGIGRAIVDAFLAEGARVFAVDLSDEALASMRAVCPAPDRVETAVADVGDAEKAIGLVREAIHRMSKVDVLVNNAGVMPDGPALDITVEQWDNAFDVNARGPFFTMQAASRHMIEHGGGAIVNIASANAFRVESPEAPYNASKAALVSITRAFAHEFGHLGIRANCVAPGETITPEERAAMTEDDVRREREYMRRVPMRRAGRAEEQASVVLFLASDEASYVNGETIVVDGGELTGDWYDTADAPPVPES